MKTNRRDFVPVSSARLVSSSSPVAPPSRGRTVSHPSSSVRSTKRQSPTNALGGLSAGSLSDYLHATVRYVLAVVRMPGTNARISDASSSAHCEPMDLEHTLQPRCSPNRSCSPLAPDSDETSSKRLGARIPSRLPRRFRAHYHSCLQHHSSKAAFSQTKARGETRTHSVIHERRPNIIRHVLDPHLAIRRSSARLDGRWRAKDGGRELGTVVVQA